MIVDDLPVLTSIAYGDRWCQEMPQPIRRLPVEEIIQFVNNPPDKAQNSMQFNREIHLKYTILSPLQSFLYSLMSTGRSLTKT